MRYLALGIGVLASTACGPGVADQQYVGAPLVVLHGRISGEIAAGQPTDDVRAALVWAMAPELEACATQATDLTAAAACLDAPGIAPRFAAEAATIESDFPADFEIPLYELPDPTLLAGGEGGTMGIGGLVVFNDGNHNGELDLIEIDATESVDTVLGAQRFENLEAILFREGDATDLVELLDMAGCPDSPQGFSLIRVQGGFEMALGCEILGPETTIEVTFDDSPAVRERVCQSLALPLPQIACAPDEAPPAHAVIECSADGMTFTGNFYPDRYCTAANTATYGLVAEDGACDLRHDPPSWWPCQDATQRLEVIGRYETVGRTLNESDCASEGPDAPLTPADFELLLDEYGLAVTYCDSATACSADPREDWYRMWPDGSGWHFIGGRPVCQGDDCSYYEETDATVSWEGDQVVLDRVVSEQDCSGGEGTSCVVLSCWREVIRGTAL